MDLTTSRCWVEIDLDAWPPIAAHCTGCSHPAAA